MITSKTTLVGLIGWPIKHSLSPAMHNAAFHAFNLDWAYLPLPVQPGALVKALGGLVALNFRGCNITVPHKEAAVRYLDQIDDASRVIGAVNSISIKDGRLEGFNTDPHGFLMALQSAQIKPEGWRVLVLGAGGAARSVVYALGQAVARSVTVVNRHPDRAVALVRDMNAVFPASHLSYGPLETPFLSDRMDHFDLIVNATSVGMYPDTSSVPWPDQLPFPGGAVYCDLVYNPQQTAFLSRAMAAGAWVVGGLEMLIHQGAQSFESWTGHEAPIEVMRLACRKQLGQIKKSINDNMDDL